VPQRQLAFLHPLASARWGSGDASSDGSTDVSSPTAVVLQELVSVISLTNLDDAFDGAKLQPPFFLSDPHVLPCRLSCVADYRCCEATSMSGYHAWHSSAQDWF
jgi:hypothetical protein